MNIFRFRRHNGPRRSVAGLLRDYLASRRWQRDMRVFRAPDPRCERPGSIESFYRERERGSI